MEDENNATKLSYNELLMLNNELVLENKLLKASLNVQQHNEDFIFSLLENFFFPFIDVFPTPTCFIDKNQNHLFVNAAYQFKFKVTLESIKGTSVRKTVGEDAYHVMQAMIERALNGEIQTYSHPHRFADGKNGYLNVTLVPLFGLDKETIGYFGFLSDVTENLTNIKRLKESEAKFRSYVEHAPDGIFVADGTGKYVEVNDAACKITGYSKNDLMNMNIGDLVGNEGRADAFSKHLKLFEGEPSQFEIPFLTKDGIQKYMSLAAVKLDDNNFLGFAKDITERVISDKELQLSRFIIQHTSDSVFVFKCNGSLFDVNPAACTLLGYKHDELLELNVADFDLECSFDRWPERVDLLQKNGFGSASSVFVGKNKNKIYVDIAASYLEFDNQHFICAFVRDVTSRKMIEQDLIRMKEKAEISDRLKTAFLSNISHEIRTPMNAILGYSQMIDLDCKKFQHCNFYTQQIQKGCTQLLEVVTNVIEVSQIQIGQIKLIERSFTLRELYNNIKDEFCELNEKSDIELNLMPIAEEENKIMIADSYKLFKVCKHLINNALKFTNNGFVKVSHQFLTGNLLQFSVADSGIGISREMFQVIFEPFRQIEFDLNRAYDGNGVGLSICKSFVEFMGGKIWLESTVGIGTTFYFTLAYKLEK